MLEVIATLLITAGITLLAILAIRENRKLGGEFSLRDSFLELKGFLPSTPRSAFSGPGAKARESADLSRALALSLDRTKGWFTKTVKVHSGSYVVMTHPDDFLPFCADADAILAEVVEYLKSKAESGQITLVPGIDKSGRPMPFELRVAQVLPRARYALGQPKLLTYAAARAEEIAAGQHSEHGTVKYQVPEIELLEPGDLLSGSSVGLGLHPLTGTAASPVSPSPAEAAAPSRVDPPTVRGGDGPGGRQSGGATVLVAPPRSVASFEVLSDSPSVPHRFLTLADGATYGRSSDFGDCAIDSPGISRKQFRLQQAAASWWLEDLGGSTTINGEPVDGLSELHDGDRVGLAGEVELVLNLPAGDSPTSR